MTEFGESFLIALAAASVAMLMPLYFPGMSYFLLPVGCAASIILIIILW